MLWFLNYVDQSLQSCSFILIIMCDHMNPICITSFMSIMFFRNCEIHVIYMSVCYSSLKESIMFLVLDMPICTNYWLPPIFYYCSWWVYFDITSFSISFNWCCYDYMRILRLVSSELKKINDYKSNSNTLYVWFQGVVYSFGWIDLYFGL